jgi:hypothetical protein
VDYLRFISVFRKPVCCVLADQLRNWVRLLRGNAYIARSEVQNLMFHIIENTICQNNCPISVASTSSSSKVLTSSCNHLVIRRRQFDIATTINNMQQLVCRESSAGLLNSRNFRQKVRRMWSQKKVCIFFLNTSITINNSIWKLKI